MANLDAWAAARHVLAVRLDGLGDVLMTEPAIRALGTVPGRRVTLLTSSAGAAVAHLLPGVDEVIVYDAPWMKATPPRTDRVLDTAVIDRLAAARFDAAVVFTVYSQNPQPAAFVCTLAGIPLRLAHCRENPYQLLTDWVREPEPQHGIRHEVQRQLDLVREVGCGVQDTRMTLRLPPAAPSRARALLRSVGLDPRRPWIAVHPGATAESRRYPPALFGEVVRRLDATGRQILFVGTRAEHGLIETIRGTMARRSYSVAGRTDVAGLAGVLGAAPLLVANNSGPMHIAAAVGTPVVALYALTNPQHTPWAVRHRLLNHDVPCRLCYRSVCPEGHHACLRGVPPDAVVTAALALLAEAHPAAEPAARAGAAG